MDIKFKKIHIENFMSIGEADIDLSDRAFTLIEGVNNNENDNARSNGSGKSSIFEALVWVLTGTTMRGNKDIVNYNGTDGALVKLELIIDNNSYCIIRTKEHSKYKTNLFIEINGVDKSGKGVRDTEKLLSEYLPDLTGSLIGSVIVLGQGLPQKFTNNSPSGRKEVLEKLFKSDFMIQDLKDRISTRKGELNEELRKVQDSKLVALTKLESIIDTINLNNTKLKQLQEQNNLEVEADVLHKEILEVEERQIQLKDEIDTYTIKRDEANTKISSSKIRKAEIIAEIDKEYESTKEFANDGINSSKVALELAKSELNKVKNILEIGSAIGYSAINMALAGSDVTVTTIERDKDRYIEAVKNVKKIGLDERITLILADALDFNSSEEFDLIFIDAAKSQYIKFFEKFSHNLKSKGYIVTDNIKFHGFTYSDKSKLSRNLRQLITKLEKYIEFLKNNKEFKTRFFDVGDGIAISRRAADKNE